MARKSSLTVKIRQLKIGESAIFPIERLATVQSSASREGLISGSGAEKNSRHNSGLMASFSVLSDCGIFTFAHGLVLIRITPLP